MPSYTANSNIFGSTNINLTSSGSDLNNKLNNIALSPTDFPDPVVPATNKCGIFAKSTTIGLPEISWPSATLRFEGEDLKALEESISVSLTIFLLLLGISIPTYDLPSMTSTTLTLLTDSDLAISWAIFVILLAFVPGAGWISNRVTTGPGKTDSTVASIPNSSSLASRSSAIWFNSLSDKELPSSRALSSSSVLGIIAFSLVSSLSLSIFSFVTSFNGDSLLMGKSPCLRSCLLSSVCFSFIWGSFEILGFDEGLTLLSFLICIVVTIFFTFAKKRVNEFFRLCINLDKSWRLNLPEIINSSPVLSRVFNQEKLKANEVAGINNITRKINDPMSPIEEDNEVIISLPIKPPKLSRK